MKKKSLFKYLVIRKGSMKKYEDDGYDYPIGFVRWTEKRNFEAVLDLMAKNPITLNH